jgi:uncharacterized repeat protein (TIGR01451 family)
MKRQIGKNLRRLAVTTLAAFLAAGASSTAFAEFNQGTGDIAGDTNALADSNNFQLSSTGAGLALVKTAWMTSDGSPITSGSTVPQGTSVDFMIYVNNIGSVDINDVSIQDVLDALFVYQAGTIRVANVALPSTGGSCALAACDTDEEAEIYAAVSVVAANSDGVDGDTSSFAGATVDVGNQTVANGQLDVTADRVLGVVFTVQVQ